jgi:hypothetical protein
MMNDSIDFRSWMTEVDKHMVVEHKCTTDDLPDCLYHDWYDNCMNPQRAASIAWLNAISVMEVD